MQECHGPFNQLIGGNAESLTPIDLMLMAKPEDFTINFVTLDNPLDQISVVKNLNKKFKL